MARTKVECDVLQFGLDLETKVLSGIPYIAQCAIVGKGDVFCGCDADDIKLWFEMVTSNCDPEKETDIRIGAHNGGKFDWWFLQDVYMMFTEMGWKVTPIVRNNVLITMQILNKTPTKKGRTKGLIKIIFMDTLLAVPGSSVAELGNMVGLSKLYPPMGENFEEGWEQDFDFSYSNEESWKYVIRDAEIVYHTMCQLWDMGYRQVTASGNTFHAYQERLTKGWKDNKIWYDLFPDLSKVKFEIVGDNGRIWLSVDDMARPGYAGGINYSLPGHYVGLIIHIDINSMYPTQMVYRPLPYGVPLYSKDKPLTNLWIRRGQVKLHLKKDMIPVYKFKYKFDCTLEGIRTSDNVIDTKEWHYLVLTNVDFEYLSKFYDIELGETQWYLSFRSKSNMFSSYVKELYQKKTEIKKRREAGEEVNEFEYAYVKVLLNSLYGRFGMSNKAEDWEFTDKLEPIIITEADGSERRSVSEIKQVKFYLPVAMFVCAWARYTLCEAVEKVIKAGGTVIHMDTDSIIFTGCTKEEVGLDYDSTQLGKWDVEGTPIEMYEGGAKRYVEIHKPLSTFKTGDKVKKFINVKCAGAPQDKELGFCIEIADDPALIMKTGQTIGDEHYCIHSQWLKDAIEDVNKKRLDKGILVMKDVTDMNTMKLARKKYDTGVRLVEVQWTIQDMMKTKS